MPETFRAQCACGRVVFEATGPRLASIACYCDDCQAAAKQFEALPGGHSGRLADGSTISTLYRKDRVRCVQGAELLRGHKLRPTSPATRQVTICCNSNMTTLFENWLPITALRTHAQSGQPVQPELCIYDRYAPDATMLLHTAPRHPGLPSELKLKVAAAAVTRALRL